jgi:glycosyltransferase involved in cell wall biosynthesis
MRVLYVSPYPPAPDGIGRYTYLLAEAMRDRGSDVRVVTPRPAADARPEVAGTVGWLRWREADLRRIGEFRPNVIHLQFAVAAFGARTITLARRMAELRSEFGVPVVVTMHEVTRDTALLGPVGRALYRRLAAVCDLVIVHTNAALAALSDQVGVAAGGVSVIPHPATTPPAGATDPAELRARFGIGTARILLAFGFVHVDKGLEDLVAALAVLRRTATTGLDDVRVVVAGAVRRRHGPFRAFELRDHLYLRRVLRLARRRGVRDRLILTGYVPDRDVAGWFAAAAAAVLPYRRIEQSGVAGLAVALDVPVLASRVGGLDELFGGSPWTFAAADPAGLADVIAGFLASPEDPRSPANRPVGGADIPAVTAATENAYDRAMRGLSGRGAHVG